MNDSISSLLLHPIWHYPAVIKMTQGETKIVDMTITESGYFCSRAEKTHRLL